ncbi:BspA family leucine-rich repeat surface protein [Enterococcus hulanensis]|uniref:BspA family leucine-rich repeat surface protein n=1 Tax=Enterococcus hulanensis TaxID=2559929 RepID=UPI0010F554E9|nr:BspA family leucine-rich repeat surface protein [Enterococcus hulanensis]
MNNKRMGKHAERVQRFVYKKINKQLISVAGSVLIVLGGYAIIPVQVLATETATEAAIEAETTQVQQSNTALPTVASSELSSETQPTTANEESAAQEKSPSTTDDAKAPKETEPKPADETKKSEETDQQANTAKTRAQAQPQSDAADEGWEYENRETYVEITDYKGDLVDITVPAKIDGLPVEINLGTVLKEKMANTTGVTKTFKIESAGEGETPVKLVGTFEKLFYVNLGQDNETLTSVDFGNADCSGIQDMSYMFRGCSKLRDLNVTGWNTSQVQDMTYMFSNCSKLQNLDVSSWNTSQVQTMEFMFIECMELKELDLSGWKTSQVQDMASMFISCNQLKELDLSGWDTSNVQDMALMFGNCSQLQDLDLSDWKTSQVQDMYAMFQSCSQLRKLDLSNWETKQVQDMNFMFQECTQLQELNLSGWDTSSVQKMYSILSRCDNLSKLTLSSDFKFNGNTGLRGLPETTSRWVKDDFAEMYDSTAAFIAAHNNLTETATNHTYKIKDFSNPTAEGWGFVDKGTHMEITSYNGDLTNITVPAKIYGKPVEIDLGTVLKSKMANENEAVTRTFKIEAAGEGETPVKLVGTFKVLFARPSGGVHYFNTTLTSVNFGNADCSEIQDMSYMFSHCNQLRDLNVTDWNTSQVQDMTAMFDSCSELQNLDVSSWNTSQVQNMSYMFLVCSQLKELDVTGWKTSQVQDMSYMFTYCSKLQDLDLSSWNTSHVQDMSRMFASCEQLKVLDVSGWDTSNVHDMTAMFDSCSELKSLNLTGWDTSNVHDMAAMFDSCSELKSLNLTGWDTSSVQYTTNMFYNCTQLKALDLSDWNTNQIRWMNNMFANCYQLEKLDLSSWDIGELDRTDNMFSDCTQLQELNLSGWDTSNVTVMDAMFSNCAQLQKLNLSGWDTSSVQYMMGIFSGCDNLSKVILSSDFKFGDFHHLPFFPPNSGTTTYHWVKDDYTDVYDSTDDFTAAHNNLTETATNHVYTIQKKHEVSFDLNDGSGKAPDPQYIFEGKLADNPDYEGTKGDLFFDCWTFNSLPFTFDTPITEPVELVASWRKARYTIKFDANGGEGTMSDQVLSIDEEKSLSGNQFTRKGYDFVEWNE